MNKALWVTSAHNAELLQTDFECAPGELEIKTLFSGISRGTERLVFSGNVPESEHETMRAPFQQGSFSFPVKYGYAAVGEVLNTARKGEIVFALFPHQTRFSVPAPAALTVPADVPKERAILAANMETALNVIWDATVNPGDKVVVIGCGVVGALTGYLAAGMVGTEVTLVDVDEGKSGLAHQLGCDFAQPDAAPSNADVVIHCSATEAGLATAIACAGVEAKIVEASWFGAHLTQIPLGGSFHQRRLKIISSQVGHIPAHQAARWTYARRLSKALSLLADARLDALISSQSDFAHLAQDYEAILNNPDTLCHRVRYDPQG